MVEKFVQKKKKPENWALDLWKRVREKKKETEARAARGVRDVGFFSLALVEAFFLGRSNLVAAAAAVVGV